jgi:hypothetical protein
VLNGAEWVLNDPIQHSALFSTAGIQQMRVNRAIFRD